MGQPIACDLHLCAFAHDLEQLRHIPRGHPDTAVARWGAQASLLRRPVDVDVTPLGVPVLLLQTPEPQDARDDRVASGRVHRHDLPGGFPALELHPEWLTVPDLGRHFHPAERCRVAPGCISKPELRGRNRVSRQRRAIAKQQHLLVRYADQHRVAGVFLRAAPQSRNQGER